MVPHGCNSINDTNLTSYTMKRSEFVPGVLFHMPGINRYQVFQVVDIGDGCHMIQRHGNLFDGRLFLEREIIRKHFELSARGIKLWDVVDTVYLFSKTIPFEALTIAKVSSPATNPISI